MDNGENAWMHETDTYTKWDAHDDMIKCNTQANDMEITANNWKTPGSSNPGRYNTPPLTRDLVPRSQERDGRKEDEVQQGRTREKMNNAMPPEELKKWNEKNLEGRVEWSCRENQQRKNKLVVDLWKNISKLEVKLCHNQMSEQLRRMKKCKTPLQNKTENYLLFKTEEEKILELLQQNLDELLKNELKHEEPP